MGNVAKIKVGEKLNWESILQEFLLFKKAEGRSETTIKDYNYHVNAFFKKYPEAVDEDDLNKYVLKYMGQEGIAPATFNIRLIYLRAFFSYCADNGYLIWNPLMKIKKRKTQDRIVDIPEEVLKKLLKLPNKETFCGLRDYTLILLTFDTGIRPSEAFSLFPNHLNLDYLRVTIPAESAKTRQERILPITAITAQTVKQLINAHSPDWEDSPIFCSYTGNKLDRSSWAKRLKGYSQELSYQITPYDLRHAFAVMYLRGGGHAFSLQNTLGHEDMSMTKRYVTISDRDLKTIHTKASPVNTLVKPKNKRKRKI